MTEPAAIQFRPIGPDLYETASALTGVTHRLHVNGTITCNCRSFQKRGRCRFAEELAHQLAERPRCVNCGQLDAPFHRLIPFTEHDAERDQSHIVLRCADRDACWRRTAERYRLWGET